MHKHIEYEFVAAVVVFVIVAASSMEYTLRTIAIVKYLQNVIHLRNGCDGFYTK